MFQVHIHNGFQSLHVVDTTQRGKGLVLLYCCLSGQNLGCLLILSVMQYQPLYFAEVIACG